MPDISETALVFYGCASGGGEDNFVSLVKGQEVLYQVVLPSQGLAQSISDKVSELLNRTKETPQLVSVVTGPGSFTGLRSTIAVAQGLSLGWNVPLVGATLYQAMLNTVKRSILQTDDLWVLHHARRGYVYALSPLGDIEVLEFEQAAKKNFKQVAGNAVDGVHAVALLREIYRKDKVEYPAHPSSVSILEAGIKKKSLSTDILPLYGEGARISKPKSTRT